jgi:hypothetical protein
VVSEKEPSGKPLSVMKKLGEMVRVDGGLEDLDLQKRFGAMGLRRVRLVRMKESIG